MATAAPTSSELWRRIEMWTIVLPLRIKEYSVMSLGQNKIMKKLLVKSLLSAAFCAYLQRIILLIREYRREQSSQ